MIDLAFLKSEGYAIAKNVFDPVTLADVDRLSARLIADDERSPNSDTDFWRAPSVSQGVRDVLFRIHNFETKSPAISALTAHPTFARLTDLIYNCPIYAKEVALVIKKPSCGLEVPWHRDPVPVGHGEIYNFSIYLDRSTTENGCLEVLPRSHLNSDTLVGRPNDALPVEADVGDVIVHDVRIYHGSKESLAQRMRRSIVMEVRRRED